MTGAHPDAPVFETASIEIAAGAEVVWDTLTDLDSWARWMPGVTSVATHGPFVVGSTFEWKAGPGTIRSEVVTTNRPSSAAWRGRTFGVTALHGWTIEPSGPATTRVQSAESFSSLLAKMLPAVMRRTVRRALDEGLPALKAEAERRARGNG